MEGQVGWLALGCAGDPERKGKAGGYGLAPEIEVTVAPRLALGRGCCHQEARMEARSFPPHPRKLCPGAPCQANEAGGAYAIAPHSLSCLAAVGSMESASRDWPYMVSAALLPGLCWLLPTPQGSVGTPWPWEA